MNNPTPESKIYHIPRVRSLGGTADMRKFQPLMPPDTRLQDWKDYVETLDWDLMVKTPKSVICSAFTKAAGLGLSKNDAISYIASYQNKRLKIPMNTKQLWFFVHKTFELVTETKTESKTK